MLLSVGHYLGHELFLVPKNAAIPMHVGPPSGNVLDILRAGTNPEVFPPIVEAIRVDVVHVHFGRGFANLAMHPDGAAAVPSVTVESRMAYHFSRLVEERRARHFHCDKKTKSSSSTMANRPRPSGIVAPMVGCEDLLFPCVRWVKRDEVMRPPRATSAQWGRYRRAGGTGTTNCRRRVVPGACSQQHEARPRPQLAVYR
jgi:hypothetical protein